MHDWIQVVTTTATREDALRIANLLVEKKLAACVQVSGPLTSVYRWKRKIETAEEWRATVKTRAALFARVSDVIRAAHPYEMPEILAVSVDARDDKYIAWMDEELAQP